MNSLVTYSALTSYFYSFVSSNSFTVFPPDCAHLDPFLKPSPCGHYFCVMSGSNELDMSGVLEAGYL